MVQTVLTKLSVGVFLWLAFIALPDDCCAQDLSSRSDRDAAEAYFLNYEQKLNAVLKTRRDEEKQFVADIVERVKLKRIPDQIVVASWRWAREKRPNTKYPFIYFERVLRILATKLKLEEEIPPFDYSIYKAAGQKIAGQNGSAGQRTDIMESGTTRSATGRSAGQIR